MMPIFPIVGILPLSFPPCKAVFDRRLVEIIRKIYPEPGGAMKYILLDPADNTATALYRTGGRSFKWKSMT